MKTKTVKGARVDILAKSVLRGGFCRIIRLSGEIPRRYFFGEVLKKRPTRPLQLGFTSAKSKLSVLPVPCQLRLAQYSVPCAVADGQRLDPLIRFRHLTLKLLESWSSATAHGTE